MSGSRRLTDLGTMSASIRRPAATAVFTAAPLKPDCLATVLSTSVVRSLTTCGRFDSRSSEERSDIGGLSVGMWVGSSIGHKNNRHGWWRRNSGEIRCASPTTAIEALQLFRHKDHLSNMNLCSHNVIKINMLRSGPATRVVNSSK